MTFSIAKVLINALHVAAKPPLQEDVAILSNGHSSKHLAVFGRDNLSSFGSEFFTALQ